MSESFEPPRRATPAVPDTLPMDTAGSLLRAAREAQGLQVPALAMILKITPRKLEALENDRYEDLQGITFTRALAQATCRALKIDPAPVLARLPRAEPGALGQAGQGLNEPFRERTLLRRDPLELLTAARGVLALVAVLLIGAAALWLAPPGFGVSSLSGLHWPSFGGIAGPDGEASGVAVADPAPGYVPPPLDTASSVAAVAASAVVEIVSQGVAPGAASVPSVAEPAVLPTADGAANGIPLQLHAREATWVEVLDGRGQSLMSRTLAAGEVVGLDGVLPVRVKIGNAAGTDLTFRGQPVDLLPVTRDNIARVELK